MGKELAFSGAGLSPLFRFPNVLLTLAIIQLRLLLLDEPVELGVDISL